MALYFHSDCIDDCRFPGLARSPGEIIEELDEIVHEGPGIQVIKRPASVSARHSVSTDRWMICVLLTLSNCGRITVPSLLVGTRYQRVLTRALGRGPTSTHDPHNGESRNQKINGARSVCSLDIRGYIGVSPWCATRIGTSATGIVDLRASRLGLGESREPGSRTVNVDGATTKCPVLHAIVVKVLKHQDTSDPR